MFSFFDSPIRYSHPLIFRFGKWVMKLVSGLLVVYVGMELAGALVKAPNDNARQLRESIYKHDIIGVFSEVGRTVILEVENNLVQTPPAETTDGIPVDLTKRTQAVSANLADRWRPLIPALHKAFTDIVGAGVTPIKQSIEQETQKK